MSSDQRELLRLIERDTRVASAAANAVGKCVYAGNPVSLADGRRVPARELVGTEFEVLTLNEAGQVVVAKGYAEENRTEDVRLLRTSSGRTLIVNDSHPLFGARFHRRREHHLGDNLLSPVGWTPAAGLQRGDAVAVPTSLPAFGDVDVGDDVLVSGVEAVARGGSLPAWVWLLTEERAREFVRLLWARVGTVLIARRDPLLLFRVPACEGADWVRAREVQHLLLRVGVPGNSDKRGAFTWDARGAGALLGVIDPAGTSAVLANADSVLAGVRNWVESALHKDDGRFLKHWRSHRLPDSLQWERLISNRRLPDPAETISICVPGYETYLNDYYEHNTHLIAAYGVYWMDAVGSTLDPNTEEPEGGLWILTAPGVSNIDNLWAEARLHIRAAKRLGWEMGGHYSDRSVTWYIREDWKIEAISPPRVGGQEQAHAGAGRHHKNLLITIDEAAGVDNARYRAAEGVASGETNKIVLTFNPTELVSPAKAAYDGATYTRHRISAFNHPNVRERREVVPGAISVRTTESRIRDWCEDLGLFIPGENEPDAVHGDFLWRMHPLTGTDEAHQIPEPRPNTEIIDLHGEDVEILGHADGVVRVYRPDYRFLPTVLGLFPTQTTSNLFPPAALQKAVEAWHAQPRPERAPDQVGLDPAEGGGDEPIAIPVWRTTTLEGNPARGREARATTRYYVGRPRMLRPGLPSIIAGDAFVLYGKEPLYVVDAIGVGSGTEDYLNVEFGAKTFRFKSSHAGNIMRNEDDPEFLNRRAAAYWHFSMLVKRGLVALPDDPQLLRQLEATTYDFQKGKVRIIAKDKLREALGQSPDRADAVVMAAADTGEARSAGSGYLPLAGRARNRQGPFDHRSYYASQE